MSSLRFVRPLTFVAAYALLGTLVSASVAAHAQSASRTLAPFRDRNRVILLFAPSASDARYQKQVELFRGQSAGGTDRDLVRFTVFENGQSKSPKGSLSDQSAGSLRGKYGVRRGQFRVLLIGKDGHTAYGQASPVEPSALFRRIDRMPMRRDEMRRRGKG